jgi:hypothetical protein
LEKLPEEMTRLCKSDRPVSQSVGAAEVEPQVEVVLNARVIRQEIVAAGVGSVVVAVRCVGLHPQPSWRWVVGR